MLLCFCCYSWEAASSAAFLSRPLYKLEEKKAMCSEAFLDLGLSVHYSSFSKKDLWCGHVFIR